AMAARVSARPRTFNISFPGHGTFDEAPYARMVAKHFGTEHVEVAAEPATIDLLPELARQYDEPMADSSMVPTFLVSRLIRRGAEASACPIRDCGRRVAGIREGGVGHRPHGRSTIDGHGFSQLPRR